MKIQKTSVVLFAVVLLSLMALAGSAQALPDLVVDSITLNCGGYLFGNESNVISAKIANTGDATANASHANFVLSDGYTEKVAVPEIAANANTTVSITDPTIRNAGAAVNINVTADCDGEVSEDSDTNNALDVDETVVNNGYKGKTYTGGPNMTTWNTYELQGDLLYSVGDSYYLSGSSYPNWTTYNASWTASDLPVPGTATIKEARLYAIYTWDKAGVMPDEVSMAFNGNAQTRDAHYSDDRVFPDSKPYGMLAYNVTSDFSTSGNVANLTNSHSGGNNVSMRGMVLVVIYEDGSEIAKKILINEEFDLLYGGSSKCTTPEEATAYAPFSGTIDLSNVGSARLITVAPGAGPSEGELIFNGHTWTNVWNFAGNTQIGIDDRDVTAYLDTTNEAGFQSSADWMEASNAFLVVERHPNATVYFEPEDIRLPGYCNTTTVGVWVNTTIAMGSGQLKFNYTHCCANVTEFESNSTNFDAVANPGSLCAAVLTPGQVKINFATTAPAGLGPGPVHIGNLTIHCCNETGYCMTDLAWLPGYPDTYIESAANGFIEPVKYEDGEFRCNIPDLVITGVYGQGNDTHYTVNYTIKNEGAANAAAGHYTNLTVDGVQKETKQVLDVLAPGEEREYSFDTVLARNTSNPYDTIQVCADYDDTVVELSETNNCKGGRYPAEVVISVVPEVTIVQPQEQFDVKIHVDPRGQFIYGVQYYLKYNTSVLRAETQVKGPFLGPISDTMVVINNIDQVNGIVEYAETRKVDGGVNVPDNVSTIHFIAIGERGATSTLDLFDVVIVDENKEETLYKTNNGTVEINENQPPVPIAVSKHRTNNVAKKYQSTAILCSCSYDPDYPGKGGNVSYIRWAFGDGQYGTSEGLPVDNCTCKEHKYESWLWNYSIGDYDNFPALLTVTDDGCPELSNSSEFDVTVFIAGDADGDGEVNIIDAVWVGKHWREECATTVPCANCTVYLWDGAQVDGADLNNDCEINILDAVVIGANWRHVAW